MESGFIDLINQLITAWEIPGLYKQKELDTILSSLTDKLTHEGFRGSPAAFFQSRKFQQGEIGIKKYLISSDLCDGIVIKKISS